MTYINKWPCGTPKSTNNAFTVRPASLFANDKSEQAKATLQRKKSHYGQSTGAVAHGHAVMPGLSVEAQKRLKAVPFSAPISSGKSAKKKPSTPTLKQPDSSVCSQPHLSGGDK